VIGETKTSVASENEHIGEKQLTDVLFLDSEERDLVNIFASLSLKPSNLPARDAPWKGGLILDAATPGEFIGGLKTTMNKTFSLKTTNRLMVFLWSTRTRIPGLLTLSTPDESVRGVFLLVCTIYGKFDSN
ncbi:unnamed protein product, partial [Prunus brigantina]